MNGVPYGIRVHYRSLHQRVDERTERMVVDWSASSPFPRQLDFVIKRLLLRFGRGASISLGDIWPSLEKQYPQGSPIEIDAPQFKQFLKCRVKDRLRSDRRQTKRLRSLDDFDDVRTISNQREPLDGLLQSERIAILKAALDQLSQTDRDLVWASVEKRSAKHAELARNLGCSRRTIKRLEATARIRLLTSLDRNERAGGEL